MDIFVNVIIACLSILMVGTLSCLVVFVVMMVYERLFGGRG